MDNCKDPVKNLGEIDNFDLLLEKMQPFVNQLENSKENKIGFTGRILPDGRTDWAERGMIKPKPNPDDWVVWRNGVDKDFILSFVKEYKDYKFARIRLIKTMPSVEHYTWHKDPSARLHIPLITNPKALMYFIIDDVITPFHLTPGYLWLTETRSKHTAFNNGDTNRYHIVYEFFT